MDAVAATGATAPLGSHAADIYAKFAAGHTHQPSAASFGSDSPGR
ncbi:3-hydroxyisobutyrate dehydrogenase mmsB [Mycobacterium tuberculosis]|uniref:3-hydroxyisobutyrate dehydrogenase mmsB n=1 Tax=Mycobacterium tuberculosis TaxID=1773 RepID=A0A655AHB9_MYCTX|nr:3-hydroxyisobutyrate dehydrogenase mmsB [Mycobacterium tuberculosis]